MADAHFLIEKSVVGERTLTSVINLDRAGRISELARITGGREITDITLQSASELIGQAEDYKKNGEL
jgi:DNA repair protein RecN (Recombination protein N)